MNKDELQFIADLNHALAQGQQLDIKYQAQQNQEAERAQNAVTRRREKLLDGVFMRLPPELTPVAYPHLTITSYPVHTNDIALARLDLPGCDTVHLRLSVKWYTASNLENMEVFITDVWVKNPDSVSYQYVFRSDFSMHENILMAVFVASQVPEPDELLEPAQEESEELEPESFNLTIKPFEALQDALRAFILETLDELNY